MSRNTVLDAYQRLIADGFLVGRVGAGTFVTTPRRLQRRRAPAGTALAPRAICARSGAQARAEARRRWRTTFIPDRRPDPALFPWDEWRRLVAAPAARVVARASGYPAPEGDPRLRAAIARAHRAVALGARAAPTTCSSRAARSRRSISSRACWSSPARASPSRIRAIRRRSSRLPRTARASCRCRVDGDGLDVAALPAPPRLVYVTPSHQFPLGTPMSLARRMALLAWAERHGAAIVEDDYDSEFRFDGRPLEPLQSLDRHGRVLYVGTFSKVLLPTLRIGFLVAPPSLMPSLGAAKRLADSTARSSSSGRCASSSTMACSRATSGAWRACIASAASGLVDAAR